MIPGTNMGMHNMYPVAEDVVHSALDQASSSSETHANSLLYSLSILKDKVHQVQSLVSILVSQGQSQPESTSVAIANMGTMIQEIIVTASSMMFACQQLAIGTSSGGNIGVNPEVRPQRDKGQEGALSQPNFGGDRASNIGQERGQGFITGETLDHWYGDNYSSFNSNENNGAMNVSSSSNRTGQIRRELTQLSQSTSQGLKRKAPNNFDIVELDAADLLAKYTHYCQICSKGFKRDANLRMHMRAHGDEYKTSAALSNPMKNDASNIVGDKVSIMKIPRKYSCPQEGCRWNQKHAKFQPLKSMICAKNHYKRSHCPKMYVCKRCNRKQFSVLSDLRTHEKHCGDLKWLCSCGTTFSRKDKLMGHVALFVGHTPAVTSLTKPATKADSQPMQMQIDDRG